MASTTSFTGTTVLFGGIGSNPLRSCVNLHPGGGKFFFFVTILIYGNFFLITTTDMPFNTSNNTFGNQKIEGNFASEERTETNFAPKLGKSDASFSACIIFLK
jgi:hypothetical protein